MAAQVAVGVDGSAESLAAARWAAREAALREVPLRLLHVEGWPSTPEAVDPYPNQGPIPYSYANPQPYPYDRTGADRAADLLLDLAEQACKEYPGLEAFTGQAIGRAGDELTAAANESDVMVLGSCGLGGARGFLLGSVSLPVAGAARQPVVLVRAESEPQRTRRGGILVGIDLGHACDALLAFGFTSAARSGRSLRFVNCWTPTPSYGQARVVSRGLVEEMGEHRVKGLGDLLEPWRRRYPDVEARAEALLGGPGRQLVDASGEAELVVVGRHTRHVPLGPHLGHAAHAVVHHSGAPVAVVPVS